ncbi:hypothetical protein RRG08_039696 [Elysia crispata]|uniref:Uncharacterized protein n=1 Tax=Elysia crispata TaxID=231223 RepID=A0AAE0YAE4_9GAST|nr:hypothetical protein RRG08_039696 [Elysia crispata]
MLHRQQVNPITAPSQSCCTDSKSTQSQLCLNHVAQTASKPNHNSVSIMLHRQQVNPFTTTSIMLHRQQVNPITTLSQSCCTDSKSTLSQLPQSCCTDSKSTQSQLCLNHIAQTASQPIHNSVSIMLHRQQVNPFTILSQSCCTDSKPNHS